VFETNRSVFATNPFDSLQVHALQEVPPVVTKSLTLLLLFSQCLVQSNLVAVLGLEHQEPFVFAYLPRD
jgi:hypothetical protein